MLTFSFSTSLSINNLIIVKRKLTSFSSDRVSALNGHPGVTVEFIRNENTLRSSTQEQEPKYHWVMPPLICAWQGKEMVPPPLSSSLINRMQSWILGFQTIYLPASYLAWLCCCSWISSWSEHIFFKPSEDISKMKFRNFIFLLLNKLCSVWRVKDKNLVEKSVKRSVFVG